MVPLWKSSEAFLYYYIAQRRKAEKACVLWEETGFHTAENSDLQHRNLIRHREKHLQHLLLNCGDEADFRLETA